MLKAIRQLSHIEALLKDQLPVEAMLEVSVDREQTRLTQEQIHRIEDGIEKAVWFNESAQRLREVPGIGKVVAGKCSVGFIKRSWYIDILGNFHNPRTSNRHQGLSLLFFQQDQNHTSGKP